MGRLKVCAAMDHVRLSPRSEFGHLVLVKDQERNLLVWTPQASHAIEAIADDWQSVTVSEEMHMRPLPFSATSTSNDLKIEEGDVVLPMDSITSISTDEASKSLIVNANGLFMFQFQEGSPTHALSLISAAIESERELEEKRRLAEDPFNGDVTLKLLSSFADLKNFYFDTATNFLNNVISTVAPTNGNEDSLEGARNPWIAERQVQLPMSRFTGKHLNNEFVRSFTREDGSVPNAEALVKIVHFAGLDSSVRKRLWLAMLDVIPLHLTKEERYEREVVLREEYANISPKELSGETVSRIDKDVERTDRQIFYPGSHSTPISELPRLEFLRQILLNYCRKDASLDYVQGMNDLAAPLVYVIGDEALAFHAFSNLMASFTDASELIQNYLADIRYSIEELDAVLYDFLSKPSPKNLSFLALQRELYNMYFCYRWILVLFKREFEFDDLLLIWDVLLSAQDRAVYVKSLALAMIHLKRDEILDHCQRFDQVLKVFNDMAGKWNVKDVLIVTDCFEQYLCNKKLD